jgi:hypothetical protein
MFRKQALTALPTQLAATQTRGAELTEAQLGAVSGGLRKSSGGNTAGQMYLTFNFKLVAV